MPLRTAGSLPGRLPVPASAHPRLLGVPQLCGDSREVTVGGWDADWIRPGGQLGGLSRDLQVRSQHPTEVGELGPW